MASGLPPGVVIRVAKPEDYEDVMDIDREVYNGLDYLVYKYKEYVQDPNRICVLLKNDGRTLAFAISYIVDGGKTVLKQAGRVHPDYRGQKYFPLMEEYFTRVLAGSSRLERLVWATTNLKASEAVARKYDDIALIGKRHRFSIDFSLLDLELAMKRPEFQEFQAMSERYATLTLTPSGVKEVLSSFPQDVASMVNPEGLWVVNSEMFQPMASNYDLITKDSTVCVTMGTDRSLLAVSFGTVMHVKIGLRLYVDYYAHLEQSKNRELFVSHLLKHLLHMHQSYKGRKHTEVAVLIQFSQHFEPMALGIKDDFKRKLNFYRKSTMEDTCILMVRQLPQKSAQVSKL